jgi:hypothetical protein
VTLQETDWDHLAQWAPMATTVVPPYSEKTLTAKVHPESHELVQYSISTYGGGSYWVHTTFEKENDSE